MYLTPEQAWGLNVFGNGRQSSAARLNFVTRF
jgi:hypothetical protein